MKSLLCTLVALSCNSADLEPDVSEHYDSAVILQYHNVSSETPAITSVTTEQFEMHLGWLEKKQFKILPLTEIVTTLQQKKDFNNSYNAAITFDDAHISVCENAWPVLQKHNIPFTVFINTEAIEKKYKSQCTWQQLQEMQQSGLMTIGNHGHSHQHMVRKPNENREQWNERSREEILTAEKLIEKHLGLRTDLFAYPYGEYNHELSRLINELGYTGFGQHSGAVGKYSDFSALPRFPASGQYANLETLSVKMNSLAFPGEMTPQQKNPILQKGQDNPPSLKLVAPDYIDSVNCFDSNTGKPIKVERNQKAIMVQHYEPLNEGRTRYNCTRSSTEPNRFYWISYQWLVLP